MKKIEKKVRPEYFQAIFEEKKNYELRLNDFDIAEGDTLILKERDPQKKDYTGRELEKEVTYVGKWKIDELMTFYPKEEIDERGILIISLK